MRAKEKAKGKIQETTREKKQKDKETKECLDGHGMAGAGEPL